MNDKLKRITSAHVKADQESVVFVALGGIGEIGMNLYCYGHNGRWILVDFGVTFADHHAPGIDIITADIGFLEDKYDQIEALFITHAHEDHLGALPYLWDLLAVPIYATPFGAAMARTKLAEVEFEGAQEAIHTVKLGERVQLESFAVTFFPMTHSTLEACALVIDTPLGRIFHTGDWKRDPQPQLGAPIDEEALARIGEQPIMALIGDSTNAMEAGVSGSEDTVRQGLIDAVRSCEKGRVIVTCFATNVARMLSAIKAAEACGRQVAVLGRSIHRVLACAREAGYLQDLPPFVSEAELNDYPREKLLLICTGSQGEGRAALARLAFKSHHLLKLNADDTVIFSSKTILGNEGDIARIENALAKQGVNIIDQGLFKVHCTGHPRRDELTWLLQTLKPNLLIPCHGEYRHLRAHAQLAEQHGYASLVVTNGEVVTITKEGASIAGELDHHGRWGVDGNRLFDLAGSVFRERKRMMNNGLVQISLALNPRGELLSLPLIQAQGVFDWDVDDESLLDELAQLLWDCADKQSNKVLQNDKALEDVIRKEARRFIKETIQRKPMIELAILRVKP